MALLLAERFGERPAQRGRADDSAPSVIHLADVEDGHHSIAAAQRHGADSERDELRRMGMNDRHHVRPCPENFAVKKTLPILVGALTCDRLAVEVVFNDVAGRHDAGRHVTRNEEVARIAPASDTDVSIGIQETQLLGGQHPIGEHQIVDEPLLGTRWRRRLRDGRDVFEAARSSTERRSPAPSPTRRQSEAMCESSWMYLLNLSASAQSEFLLWLCRHRMARRHRDLHEFRDSDALAHSLFEPTEQK